MTLRLLLTGNGKQGQKIIKIIERVSEECLLDVQLRSIDLRIESPNMSDVDACIVCTPNGAHLDNCEQLAVLGIPVFLEKPISNRTVNAEQLLDLFSGDPSSIFVNYNWVNGELFKTLKSVIDSGIIGDVSHLSFACGHGYSFNKSFDSDWRSTQASTREMVGVHLVHLALSLFPDLQIKDVYDSSVSTSSRKKGYYDASSIVLIGIRLTAYLRVSYATAYHCHILMHGSDGELVYDGDELIVRAPRDTFDMQGRYAQPKVVLQKKISWSEDLSESSYKSVRQFILNVESGQPVSSQRENQIALKANQVIDLFQ